MFIIRCVIEGKINENIFNSLISVPLSSLRKEFLASSFLLGEEHLSGKDAGRFIKNCCARRESTGRAGEASIKRDR